MLLTRAKNSTSPLLDLARRHNIVGAHTHPRPFHISRQANALHPSP